MTADDALARLQTLADPVAAKGATRFFKTGAGEYGEGDQFIGVRAPRLRALAREFETLPLFEAEVLLKSPVHEARSLALLVLTEIVRQANDATRKAVYDMYLANTRFVNNWDLVDVSAPQLVGAYLQGRSRRPLYRLAKSASLWERRIAMIATQHFIRNGDFGDTLAIAESLLDDEEDLIHKAVGWMLREVGQRDQPVLEGFLTRHLSRLPRTALRYAIERFAEPLRKAYLSGAV